MKTTLDLEWVEKNYGANLLVYGLPTQ
jgi:hypothetical protein